MTQNKFFVSFRVQFNYVRANRLQVSIAYLLQENTSRKFQVRICCKRTPRASFKCVSVAREHLAQVSTAYLLQENTSRKFQLRISCKRTPRARHALLCVSVAREHLAQDMHPFAYLLQENTSRKTCTPLPICCKRTPRARHAPLCIPSIIRCNIL